MDDLPERLRNLTNKKYFAVIAVVFFAFVTALIFALLAQQTTVQNVDQLRTDIKTGAIHNRNVENGFTDQDQPTQERPPSLLDRIVSGITGRKIQNTQPNKDIVTNPNNNNQGGTNITTGNRVTSGTTVPGQDEKELLDKINREALPIPGVIVKDYVLRTALPETPEQLKIYKLKTTYTATDIENMANTLGLAQLNSNNVVTERNGKGFTQIFDLQNKHYLAINNQTGTVMFSSDNGLALASTGDFAQDALGLARSLGYTQQCLQATETYTKSTAPQSTFVDIHCEWQTTGAPIVSYFGILNLPVSEALKDISLGATPAFQESDFRPTDFNTITVQRDNRTGNILAFSSNILPVLSEISVPASNIIPAPDGLDRLKRDQKQFAFAAPQGTGFTDLRNVYINNTAQAETVDVTDFVLAYPVVPGMKQEYLCPSWISRAQGRLESGHDGLFVESASAVNDSRCGKTAVLGATTLAQNNVLPNPNPTVIEPTAKGNTLQYKNFTVEGHASSCPVKDQFTNALKISEGVFIAWIDKNVRSEGNKRLGSSGTLKGPFIHREWWIAVTSEQLVASALGNGETISAELRKDYLDFRVSRAIKCEIGSRDVCPLSSGLAGSFVACNLLTTGSPSLYVLSNTPQQVTARLNPSGGVSFAQPTFNIEDGWTFTATQNTKRHYWEYNKMALKNALAKESFDETGYVVAKKDLIGFFETTLASKLRLTDTQTYDLVGEVKREFNSLRGTNVKIVLLPRATLDRVLPVSLSPAPRDFYRYFFILSTTDEKVSLPQPQLEPISPSAYYAVETGTLILAE